MTHRFARASAWLLAGALVFSTQSAHAAKSIVGGDIAMLSEYPWQTGLWFADWGFLLGF